MRLRVFARVALVPVLALLADGLETVAADPAGAVSAAPAQRPAAKSSAPLTAPDLVSARATARLRKKRVEALSERSETATTWANPDGSLTTEMAAGPVRYRDASAAGGWRNVDVTLVRGGDGLVRTKATSRPLALSGGDGQTAAGPRAAAGLGDGGLAAAGTSRGRVALGWQGRLPVPALSGDTATYRGVSAGVDMVVQALRSGFEQSLVLTRRPAEAAPVFTMPLTVPDGVTARSDGSGGLELVDSAGAVAGRVAAPVMHDTRTDPVTGGPRYPGKVEMTFSQSGTVVTLALRPDAAYLADAATAYPVTVDPAVSIGPDFDTTITRGVTSSQASGTELIAGLDSAGQLSRSLLNWNVARFSGKLIRSATLSLWATWSATCADRNWQVWKTDPANSDTVWGNQPTWYTHWSTGTESKGRDGTCDDGWVSAGVTSLVQSWSDNGTTSGGIGLRAGSEADTSYYKKFRSANVGSNIPTLKVTYNTDPAVPTGLTWAARATYGSVSYANARRPLFSAKVKDPEADPVKAKFEVWNTAGTTMVAYVYSNFVASGATASARPNADLPDGSYQVRAFGYDDTLYSAWTAWVPFTVDATAPPKPTVTSAAYPDDGAWHGAAGTAGSFTLTPANSDTAAVLYSLDEAAVPTSVATTGSAVTVSITPATEAIHTLTVQTRDKAGNLSPATVHTFRVGAGAVTSPEDGGRTARRVQLSSESQYGSQMRWQYRRGDADTWREVPAGDVVKKSDGSDVSWPVAASGGKSPDLLWNVAKTIADAGEGDGTLQVRGAYDNAGTTVFTAVSSFALDRQAQDTASVAVGPGAVNLLTGDYMLSSTDASAFGMAITRSASSRSAAAGAAREGMVAPFGSQWSSGGVAEIPDSAYQMLRRTSTTSVQLVMDDDSTIGFTAKTGGGWTPEAGAEDLALTGSLSSGDFTLTDSDGTVTTFAKPTSSSTVYTVQYTTLPVDNAATQYVYENVAVGSASKARLWKIIASTSAVANLGTCNVASGAPPAGCRVLELVYAGSTTATASALGDYGGQVSQVRLWATAPGASAATSATLARYVYDEAGRLRQVWDPRISPALRTTYTYDDAGRVATLTPPGEQPWTFTYGQAGTDGGDTNVGRLLEVSRPTLTPGSKTETNGTAKTSIVYGVPLTKTAGGPYDLDPSVVGAWGQDDKPVDATAVFPADQVPTDHTGAGNLASGDYGRATVHYLDVDGREVNEAMPGGHVSTTEYDQHGNTVRTLTAGNRELALGGGDAATARLVELGIATADVPTRARLLSSVSVYSDDGMRELESFEPLHPVTLEHSLAASGSLSALAAGTVVPARSHTRNAYDQGRPTDGSAKAEDLVTRTESGASIADYITDADVRALTTAYDWTKGLPTTTVEDPGGLAITKTTSYDAQGRVVDTTMPKSNGSDAGATHTTYYSATGSGTCAGRPEWADLLCQVGPKGTITGGGSNPTQLVTKTTTYTYYGAADTVTETANGVTRTTATSYDTAGRPTTVATAGGVGTAMPAVTVGYDTATGRATTTTSSTGGTITRSYDTLGRPTSYADADGNLATTRYDALDRPAAVTDGAPSSTTYSYDTSVDPRGLLTSMTDSVAGTFTARYDSDGSLVTQGMPGGVTQTTSYDETGSPATRQYTQTGVTDPLLSEEISESVHGQQITHSGVSDQTYGYDNAGRLTTVDDSVTDGADVTCTHRTYGFDLNSNRTAQTTNSAAVGAACPTTAGTSSGHSYDSADRLVDSGYIYDAFGRTTGTPTGVANAYFVNDLIQRQTFGAERETWTLDPQLRFRGVTSESSNLGVWSQTESRVNHYDADGDSPDWTVENTSTGAVTRNVTGLGGDLVATTGSSGVVLQLTNLHGDVNVELPVSSTLAATVLDTDEFGSPRDGMANPRYGWLGAKRRAADTPAGTILMGFRLYAPALGRFLQIDPIPGGSLNSYEYGAQDPVNNDDTSGCRVKCKMSKGRVSYAIWHDRWITYSYPNKWKYSRHATWIEAIITLGSISKREIRFRWKNRTQWRCHGGYRQDRIVRYRLEQVRLTFGWGPWSKRWKSSWFLADEPLYREIGPWWED